MPAPRWLTQCWKSAHFCGRCVCTLVLWCLWLVLTVTAGVQIYLASVRRLEVPEFALRNIEERLRTVGLAVTFGEATFDPTGHLFLRDVAFSTLTLTEPVLQVDTLTLDLNPTALVMRDLDVRSAELTGANVLLPAVLSPSGRSEPLLRGAHLRLRPDPRSRILTIDTFTGWLGPLAVELRGTAHIPAGTRRTLPPLDEVLGAFSHNFPHLARVASDQLLRLPATQHPQLQLHLTADPARIAHVAVAFDADQLDLPATGERGTVTVRNFQLRTAVGLLERPRLTMIEARVDELSAAPWAAINGLNLRMEALVDVTERRVEPRLIDLVANRVELDGLRLDATAAQWAVATWPEVQSRGRTWLEGQPLTWDAQLNPATRAGQVAFSGELAASLLPWLTPKVGFDVPALLSWDTPPVVSGAVTLAEGGKPTAATFNFNTGPVVARRVPLDATAANVRWAGQEITAENILLRVGASEARGSFTTDPATRDFQFLLGGRLEPPAIAGWFKDWWPRFWSSFDFRGAPPDASVEVAGRWQEPLTTQVFVSADGRDAGLKGMEFDRLRTRLFLRPGFVDVLEFRAQDAKRDVAGAFSRSWLMPGGDRWTRIELSAFGRTDLEPAPALLGPLGAAIIEPFSFSQTVDLHLTGHAERPTGSGSAESFFLISGQAEGPWSFKAFPFEGVTFNAQTEPNRIMIDAFEAGASGGTLTGRIELRGAAEERRAAFDLNLDDATLGRTIREVEIWSAQRRGETAPPVGELQSRIANGRLNLSVSAEGPIADFYAFNGQGSALIDEANLAEINLLGVLSPLLRRTLLNFTNMQLNAANAEFAWRGSELDFSSVKLTGPRAAIDAHGTYLLRNHNLEFQARIRPFDAGGGLLNVVTSPLTNALEVKLTGELRDPNWVFVFGPTNLLRNLTGADEVSPESPPPSAPLNSEPVLIPPTAPPPPSSPGPDTSP